MMTEEYYNELQARMAKMSVEALVADFNKQVGRRVN